MSLQAPAAQRASIRQVRAMCVANRELNQLLNRACLEALHHAIQIGTPLPELEWEVTVRN